MQKHLFFICPTDHLEFAINRVFPDENYFFTSLGNSVSFDEELMVYLNEMLLEKKIQRVTFVLNENNAIVVDAMKSRSPSSLDKMEGFYSQVAWQEDATFKLWRKCDSRMAVLSNLLNHKMEEFKACLNKPIMDQLEIDAKIYSTQKKSFANLESLPFNRRLYNLN